ncbi:hypothetical protein C8R47DRAFT_675658 [Mycena vitilis]|nr:hypothetical protein C8R47DRAFT_675658 [Mycena vitilis]
MDSSTPRTSCSSFFFHPPKVSSPIEIPGRQHDEYALPPAERTTSPELLFDMELSPIDRLSTHYSFGLPTSPRTKEKDANDDPEPLLYRFPVAHHIDTHPRPPPKITASFSLPPITHQPPKSYRRSKSTLQLGSPPPEPDPAHAIRAVPLHKITGFTPDDRDGAAPLPLPEAAIENAHANAKAPREKQKQPLTPLTPPARLASSPWVREASTSALDDELGLRALDVDPGAGADFTQYLLRRIDSQKPLQFQTFRVMSVSVR